ncbi:hypothetical protein [Dyella sp. Tek66A03]|uniref:hypothetical protein n=1 Tax=Dyella sp. Tek66A03 TaxID=3458298 RepID=UPI00403EB7D8
MEVTVKVLTRFGTSFLCALAAVSLAMLMFSLFDSHAFKPFVAAGVATGIGLASAIRAKKELSTNAFAVLVGILAALGSAAGGWLSNG